MKMKRDNQEFLAYKEQLESFPYYTLPSDKQVEEYYDMINPPKQFNMKFAKSHPSRWAYFICGIQPYYYQHILLDHFFRYDRVSCVTSRQIGKSTAVALFAFWAAYNNVRPVGIDKRTKVVITSHSERAAKKLIQEIKKIIKSADEQMSKYTQNNPNHVAKYFTDRFGAMPTQERITFTRGEIVVYPPTGAVRGESPSFLIIDEADFLKSDDPEYFFNSEAKPAVSKTGGAIFCTSTPNGKDSFFKKLINPDEDKPLEGWKRLWFPWTVVNDDNHINFIWNERKNAIATGDELDFKIEYEASFLSGKHTFFNPEIIDKCVFDYLAPQDYWNEPVTIGIDFGDTFSRTVVVVTTHDTTTNTTTLLNLKEFPAGFNNADIVPYMQKLRENYSISKVVVDDCVGGATAISLLERAGFILTRFVFRKSKLEYYEYMKNAFANNRIKLYKDFTLIAQLKSLESHETHMGNTQIKKPTSGRDDRADALMLACSPHITPQRRIVRSVL